jgi:arsenite methyltransferase
MIKLGASDPDSDSTAGGRVSPPTSFAAADLLDQVRTRYAGAALLVTSGDTCGTDCCGGGSSHRGTPVETSSVFGPGLYDAVTAAELPDDALLASLGCGNPTAVAELREGETVLDLGSGGGIDVLLSARRVGATGFAYGVDMTDEMLDLARANAEAAGARNVSFLKGRIEAIPLPDASVDVIISNCVVNLSVDKPAVFAEMTRVLKPGGRIGISDVVAEDHLSPDERRARGSFAGCIAGALSRSEYLSELLDAGLAEPTVEFTHEVARELHAAIITARRRA